MSGRGERTEEATPKRRKESRREGQIARSPEVVTWAQLLAASFLLRLTVSRVSASLMEVTTELDRVAGAADPGAALRLFGRATTGGALALLPLLGGLLVVGVAGQFAQTGLALSPKAIRPKWHRISPAKGLRRLLSPASTWDMVKSLLKLAVLSAMAWPAISQLAATLTAGPRPPAGAVLAAVTDATLRLLRNTSAAGLALALADYGFQRRRVRRSTMMTRQEVREEHRQAEGDPHLRARIRQRQVEMSRHRMMAEVARSSVVVVNPTHIAVALRYEPSAGAPRVVAKGRGAVAARIREEAERHGVRIVRDVPLARTLHDTCRLGQEIPAELYEAVARLLAFVFSLARRSA